MILDEMKMVQTEPAQDDFQGEDGLMHCGVCGEAKEALLPEGAASFFGSNHRPRPCACERKRLEDLERQQREMAHTGRLIELRQSCFRSGSYGGATFKASTEDTEALRKCQRYVEHWDKVQQENLGLLLWGNVGTGKSYAAAAIANALIEKEVSVHMRNLSEYMNAGFEARGKLLQEVARPELLILDDFGVERGTEYCVRPSTVEVRPEMTSAWSVGRSTAWRRSLV